MAKAAERPVKTGANLSVADFLTLKIDSCGKSQSEIAQEIGYPNPNIITMFKQGRTKVPIPKVPAIAKALEIDPVHLMRLVMNEYSPETWAALENVLGSNIVTDSEMSIIKSVREVAGDHDVSPQTNADKEELKSLITKWVEAPSKTIRHR